MVVGDKVIVTKRLNGHEFQIGETVEIFEYDHESNDYNCTNGVMYWWLTEDEFKPLNQEQ